MSGEQGKAIARGIAAELDRHETEMRRLVEDLKAQIAALPDNPRITRISKQAFTISSRDIGSNWSAEHHDFKCQYRKLVEMIERAEPGRAVAIVRNAVEDGAIRPSKSSSSTIRLHPDVVAHLKTLLGLEAPQAAR
jgi:DNA-binding GntR family transcriptional regulator